MMMPVYMCTAEVKIVKQMPTQTEGRKPTIAIITSKYYEKLAVDSMMEDKTTFVRYKTEGQIHFCIIHNICISVLSLTDL